jgi:hydroxypyruvate isomerase
VATALKAMGYVGPIGMEANAAGNEEKALAAFSAAFA